MKQLTVFTPTYNRAYTLPRLYGSLLRQDTSLFKWLIVDDGSTDNTREIVESWIDEGRLEIKYVYERNSGKTAAHNLGVRECDTELFMCCDSDDWIVEGSIEPALEFWNAYQNELAGIVESECVSLRELSGMVSPRNMKNGDVDALSTLPVGKRTETLSGLYRRGFKGETALIFKTSVIREYPFPQIDGEKFIPEGYVYNQLDEKYDLLVYPHYCMECEYQEDGYSNNGLTLRLKNPKGFLMADMDILKRHFSLKQAIRCLGLNGYLGKPYKIAQMPHVVFMLLLLPLGKLLERRYKKIAKEQNIKR